MGKWGIGQGGGRGDGKGGEWQWGWAGGGKGVGGRRPREGRGGVWEGEEGEVEGIRGGRGVRD